MPEYLLAERLLKYMDIWYHFAPEEMVLVLWRNIQPTRILECGAYGWTDRMTLEWGIVKIWESCFAGQLHDFCETTHQSGLHFVVICKLENVKSIIHYISITSDQRYFI